MADGVRDRPSITRNNMNICELCGAFDKLLLCGGCKRSYYCCREHQKSDWKNHKRTCKTFSNKSNKNNEVVDSGSRQGTMVPGTDHKINPATDGRRSESGLRDTDCVPSFSNSNTKQNVNREDSGAREFVHDEQKMSSSINMWDDGDCSFKSKYPENQDQLKSSSVLQETQRSKNTDFDLEQGSSEYYILESEVAALNTSVFEKDLKEKGAKMPQMDTSSCGAVAAGAKSDSSQAYVAILESRTKVLGDYVVQCLKRYGICVIDNFLGDSKGLDILNEVKHLHSAGALTKGQLVNSKSMQSIRDDYITWVEGSEDNCENINFLISSLDAVVLQCQKKIGVHNISGRTKAMVACYPGLGTKFLRHVDNPNGDGRCVTCIYYLNKDWCSKTDGGVLRIYPEGENRIANVEPKFDRLLFFWSDRRNPHEVLPAFKTRFAITVWYYDADERKRAVKRVKGAKSDPKSTVMPLSPR